MKKQVNSNNKHHHHNNEDDGVMILQEYNKQHNNVYVHDDDSIALSHNGGSGFSSEDIELNEAISSDSETNNNTPTIPPERQDGQQKQRTTTCNNNSQSNDNNRDASNDSNNGFTLRKAIVHIICLLSGPVLSIPFYFDILNPGHSAVSHCAGVTIWMACWWFLEPVPVAITSLLPVFLFPVLGLSSSKEICSTYFSDLTFLFLGSYIVAISLEKWNCHRRFALFFLLKVFGVKRPKLVLLGFMSIAWFCSMWLSNTCTAAMLLPMASAVLSNLDKDNVADQRFSKAVTVGIAYSCSIGGFSTLTGTGTNLVFVNTLSSMFPKFGQFSFLRWMLFSVPLSALLNLMTFALFIGVYVRNYQFSAKKTDEEDLSEQLTAEESFQLEYQKLGPIKMEEYILLGAFSTMCLLWITRQMPIGVGKEFGWSNLLFWGREEKQKYVTDATVAILISIVLFIIPSRSRPGEFIMDWQTVTQRLPWSLLLLFGAGLALAKAFTISKFSEFISNLIVGMGSLPPFLILLTICMGITFLTEVTSNIATASLLLPIIGNFAVHAKVHQNPLYFMIPATICTSCAFMSPVGTPPNAIAFAYGYVKMADMIKLGLLLNVTYVFVIGLWMYVGGGPVLGVYPGSVPNWANTTMVDH